MKIQRTPLILLAIAIVLGTFVYFYETQAVPQREAAKTKTEQLFDFKEEDVRTLDLTTPTQALSFVKTPPARLQSGASPSPGASATPSPPPDALVWAMVAPKKTMANDASVAYLLNLLATSKRQQTLTVPASQKEDFGLEPPIATATVKLANQQTHRLVLGKPNFNQTAYYAQVDPPAQAPAQLSIVLVPSAFANAVNRPLAEWEQKEPEPAKPTTTPSAQSATPKPVPGEPKPLDNQKPSPR